MWRIQREEEESTQEVCQLGMKKGKELWQESKKEVEKNNSPKNESNGAALEPPPPAPARSCLSSSISEIPLGPPPSVNEELSVVIFPATRARPLHLRHVFVLLVLSVGFSTCALVLRCWLVILSALSDLLTLWRAPLCAFARNHSHE